MSKRPAKLLPIELATYFLILCLSFSHSLASAQEDGGPGATPTEDESGDAANVGDEEGDAAETSPSTSSSDDAGDDVAVDPSDAEEREDSPTTGASSSDSANESDAPSSSTEQNQDESVSEIDRAPDAESDAEANSTSSTETQDSGIRGRILDSETGEGLQDAVVIAQGQAGARSGSAMTNDTGGYSMFLSPGRYSVMSFYDLYHGARMPRVRVRSGRFTDLTLTLDPIDAEVVAEEIEIVYRADTSSAAAQDQLRAAATSIGEGLGSEQMSQSGASDAGGAASSVVGVTLEGANLNIRGLGGRYTMVLLNGIQLPSTDPDVPSVDLDLFPTNVIDNLQISKAFTPNLPANFAGGVLDIRTVRFPTEFTYSLQLSTGINTNTTFQDGLTYRGGDLDWLGVDDGTRAVPSDLNDLVAVSRGGPYQSFDAVADVARRFPNNWQYQTEMAPPNLGIDGVIGDSINLGGQRRFGYMISLSYDYQLNRRFGVIRTRPTVTVDEETGDLELSVWNDYQGDATVQSAQLGGIATASLELGQDDVLSLLSFFNRTMEDETMLITGINAELDSGAPFEGWQLNYIARMLSFTQLRGDHRNMFGTRARLRWSAFGSYGAREEPDRRTVGYGSQGGSIRWLAKSQSGERFYSDLGQYGLGGTLDLRLPLWSEAWASIGGQARYAERDFVIRRFRMMQDPRFRGEQSEYNQPIETLFSDENIGELTTIREFTRDLDGYLAQQQYYAGYAMLETPLVDSLSLSAGARLEVFDQYIVSQGPFTTFDDSMPLPDESFTSRTDIDVLPAANVRLSLEDNMVMRAAYGMTVARPQIRELAPYVYYDFVRGRNIVGTPDLSRTLIQNADLRWEWFFGEGEILAVSAFYKYFDQPIALQIRNPDNYDSQFINAQYAHLAGGEVEFRIGLERIAEELRFFDFGANVAFIWSTTQLPEELSGAVQDERPLFGQAPYIANVSLRFQEPDLGISTSLVYNVTGPRISDVGVLVSEGVIIPDIYRQPFNSLDLIFEWRFADQFKFKTKIRNLLFQSQDWLQGDFLTESINPGMSISLGLSFHN